jgi:hypothetical protein
MMRMEWCQCDNRAVVNMQVIRIDVSSYSSKAMLMLNVDSFSMFLDFVQTVISRQQSTKKIRQRSVKQHSMIVWTAIVDVNATITRNNPTSAHRISFNSLHGHQCTARLKLDNEE